MQKTQTEGGFTNTRLGLKRFSAAYINADRASFGHGQLADILNHYNLEHTKKSGVNINFSQKNIKKDLNLHRNQI